MVEFEIGKNKYKSKTLDKLNIRDYEKVISLIGDDDDSDELEKIKGLLSILTEIPPTTLKLINVKSFLQIDWNLLIKIENEKHPILQSYEVGGETLKLKEYNKITLREFIDLEYLLFEDNRFLNVITLLLNGKEESINKNLNILDASTIFDTYVKWKEDLMKSYDDLFDNTPKDEDEDEDEIFEDSPLKEDDEDEPVKENPAWGWLDVAYRLAENIINVESVLDKKIIDIMNWLTYEKNKSDKEREMMQKTN